MDNDISYKNFISSSVSILPKKDFKKNVIYIILKVNIFGTVVWSFFVVKKNYKLFFLNYF